MLYPPFSPLTKESSQSGINKPDGVAGTIAAIFLGGGISDSGMFAAFIEKSGADQQDDMQPTYPAHTFSFEMLSEMTLMTRCSSEALREISANITHLKTL